jgi:hypothetical protein
VTADHGGLGVLAAPLPVFMLALPAAHAATPARTAPVGSVTPHPASDAGSPAGTVVAGATGPYASQSRTRWPHTCNVYAISPRHPEHTAEKPLQAHSRHP